MLIIFQACLQTCGNEEASGRKNEWQKIINGVTPDINAWPFLVRLFFSNEGVFTNSNFILHTNADQMSYGERGFQDNFLYV